MTGLDVTARTELITARRSTLAAGELGQPDPVSVDRKLWGMSEPHEVQQRLAYNEAGYRKLNEGIERGHADDPAGRQVGFRCECARLGCNAIVLLSKAEYDAVRSDGRRFFMLEGHEMPEIEDVVERHQRYIVVEKREHAGETAEAVDPRG